MLRSKFEANTPFLPATITMSPSVLATAAKAIRSLALWTGFTSSRSSESETLATRTHTPLSPLIFSMRRSYDYRFEGEIPTTCATGFLGTGSSSTFFDTATPPPSPFNTSNNLLDDEAQLPRYTASADRYVDPQTSSSRRAINGNAIPSCSSETGLIFLEVGSRTALQRFGTTRIVCVCDVPVREDGGAGKSLSYCYFCAHCY